MSHSLTLIKTRFAELIRDKEDSELKPVITENGITYVYVKVYSPLKRDCRDLSAVYLERRTVSARRDIPKCQCDHGHALFTQDRPGLHRLYRHIQ